MFPSGSPGCFYNFIAQESPCPDRKCPRSCRRRKHLFSVTSFSLHVEYMWCLCKMRERSQSLIVHDTCSWACTIMLSSISTHRRPRRLPTNVVLMRHQGRLTRTIENLVLRGKFGEKQRQQKRVGLLEAVGKTRFSPSLLDDSCRPAISRPETTYLFIATHACSRGTEFTN